MKLQSFCIVPGLLGVCLGLASRTGSLAFAAGEIDPLEGIPVISRSDWNASPPGIGRVMHQPRDLVIHHTETPVASTIEGNLVRIRNIQSYHQEEKKWPDIAYHWIVTPSGRIVEGRDWRYRGDSGTRYDLDGRLLVVLLGQFGQSLPPPSQWEGLVRITARLASRFSVPEDRIFVHSDLAQTDCPGQALKEKIESGDLLRAIRQIESSR